MGKFCIYCGKEIEPGAVCECRSAYDAPSIPIEEPAPNKFCIYCGKTIPVGTECECRKVVEKTAVETAEPKITKFCIYCGKTLYDGEVCECRKTSAKEGLTPISECEPTPVEAAPSRFCTKCGKKLVGTETCDCESDLSRKTVVKEVPESGMISGGLKLPTPAPVRHIDESERRDIEEGKSFLKKAGDLD